MSLLDASIREEEALIRAYQSELAIVRQQQRQPPPPEEESKDKDDTVDAAVRQDDTDLLEAMFPLPQGGETSLKSSLVARPDLEGGISKRECLDLTQSIQGFCFASVDHEIITADAAASASSLHLHAPPKQPRILYILRGHFVANPSVSACIRMTVERSTSSNNNSKRQQQQPSSRKRRRQATSNRVVHLQCSLRSSAGDDLSHLEDALSRTTTTQGNGNSSNSLPDWIQNVSAYLEFEDKRQDCLVRWKRTYGECCQFSTKNTSVWIQPKANRHQHNESKEVAASASLPITFIWEWDWTTEKDTVQLVWSQQGDNHHDWGEDDMPLSPKGLQDLVTCTGSCEAALDLILQTISSS